MTPFIVSQQISTVGSVFQCTADTQIIPSQHRSGLRQVGLRTDVPIWVSAEPLYVQGVCWQWELFPMCTEGLTFACVHGLQAPSGSLLVMSSKSEKKK